MSAGMLHAYALMVLNLAGWTQRLEESTCKTWHLVITVNRSSYQPHWWAPLLHHHHQNMILSNPGNRKHCQKGLWRVPQQQDEDSLSTQCKTQHSTTFTQPKL